MTTILFPIFGADGLAKSFARKLAGQVGKSEVRRFPDGESYVRVHTNVGGQDVVIISYLDHPDEKFLPLIYLARLVRELGARRVGLVCPYLPYMRQDKRFHSGEAVSSAYFAGELNRLFDWLVTVDPHLHRRKSLSEIYTIPSSTVHAAPLISRWIAANVIRPVLIGPDAESAQWVASVAEMAGAAFQVLQKNRLGDRSVRVSALDREIASSETPVLVDDVISTGHTMIEVVKRLRKRGGRKPCCIAIHALFAEDAFRSLQHAGAGRIVTCNTIGHATNKIDVSGILAEAVRQHLGGTGRIDRARNQARRSA